MIEVACNRFCPLPACITRLARERGVASAPRRAMPFAIAILIAALWGGSLSVAMGDGDLGQAEALHPTTKLAKDQESLAQKYQTLELLMLKMAEFDAGSNPQRSALLKQALLKSKDEQISQRMADIAAMLQAEQLRQAGERQGNVRQDLASILEMLLSENRSDRLKDEQDRVRRYIKDVERVLRLQRSVQGRTEAGGDTQRLSQDQSKVADRTEKLNQEIKDNELTETEVGESQQQDVSAAEDASKTDGEKTPSEESENDSENAPKDNGQESDSSADDNEDAPSPQEKEGEAANGNDSTGENEKESESDTNSNEGEAEPNEGQPGEGQPNEAEPNEGRPNQGQPGEGQPGQGQPGQGQPGEGQPGEGQPGQGQQNAPQPQNQRPSFPGQQELEQAEQQMRQAQEQLDESEREGAIKAQKKARQLLEQAKAQLEEILRQMREEEVERALAMLETRFRKMLEMQIKIFEDTEQLAAIPTAERGGQVIVQAGKLSVEERNILTEVDKALLLLREEGSSVAFPEAVEQLRDDIFQIVERLAEAKIDLLTVGLEQDVIDALQEIIEALQKAQQDAEKRRQQSSQGQPGGGGPRESPLVDAIAELKMIRALQMRVNRRTQTYSRILADPDHEVGQAIDEDLVASLQALAEREERIQQVTRDIVLEKNK